MPDGTVCVWECVEMEERNTVRQKPGYDGLCNYAQKITSCFGLDGKTRGKKLNGAGGGGVLLCSHVCLRAVPIYLCADAAVF